MVCARQSHGLAGHRPTSATDFAHRVGTLSAEAPDVRRSPGGSALTVTIEAPTRAITAVISSDSDLRRSRGATRCGRLDAAPAIRHHGGPVVVPAGSAGRRALAAPSRPGAVPAVPTAVPAVATPVAAGPSGRPPAADAAAARPLPPVALAPVAADPVALAPVPLAPSALAPSARPCAARPSAAGTARYGPSPLRAAVTIAPATVPPLPHPACRHRPDASRLRQADPGPARRLRCRDVRHRRSSRGARPVAPGARRSPRSLPWPGRRRPPSPERSGVRARRRRCSRRSSLLRSQLNPSRLAARPRRRHTILVHRGLDGSGAVTTSAWPSVSCCFAAPAQRRAHSDRGRAIARFSDHREIRKTRHHDPTL